MGMDKLPSLFFLDLNIMLADIYDCDGFVLTGGVDVHPSLFDGEKIYANGPDSFQLERDLFEAYIYRYAKANKIPVLGICRGLQLINVLEGGKLIQDLGVEKNKAHRKDEGIDKAHEVVLDCSNFARLNKRR